MRLYHLTWASNIRSILDEGLIPNCVPNDWVLESAKKRSKGRTFLCSAKRRQYWRMTYGDGWAGRADRLNVKADKGEYRGDYWTTKHVPPERIKVLEECRGRRAPPSRRTNKEKRRWERAR